MRPLALPPTAGTFKVKRAARVGCLLVSGTVLNPFHVSICVVLSNFGRPVLECSHSMDEYIEAQRASERCPGR